MWQNFESNFWNVSGGAAAAAAAGAMMPHNNMPNSISLGGIPYTRPGMVGPRDVRHKNLIFFSLIFFSIGFFSSISFSSVKFHFHWHVLWSICVVHAFGTLVDMSYLSTV